MAEKLESVWRPQPGPQTWLLTCPIFEILFGGARGGGKSDGVLGEFASHADMYGQGAVGLCVRRERTQLRELIERSKMIYSPLGAKFNEVDKMWRFPNGARLTFAYLENDSDAMSYQGHSYSRVYVEEMGTFPNEAPIKKLIATLGRNPSVPSKFIATANPGGPGHLWIKQRYIDPAPLGMKIIPTEYKNPFTDAIFIKERIFIPSKVTDNKFTNTDEYIANLYMSGSDELVKAWLLGDWNAVLGAFFPEWNASKHIIKRFNIPNTWTKFMSMDWGSAKPFSVGWWAVVPDEFDFMDYESKYYGQPPKIEPIFGSRPLILPKGAIVRYKEWYGAPKDKEGKTVPNTGVKLTAEEVAAGICLREQSEPRNENGRARIAYRVIDPSAYKEDGGPSIAERMGSYPYHIHFQKADNSRTAKAGALGGWDALRQRLKGEDGRPMIYFMDNCVEAIRTLPALQHDELKPEDVDTTGEDHAPDEIRYACMSRPYSRPTGDNLIRDILKRKDNTFGAIAILDSLDAISPKLNLNKERIH
jgi:hypothetical protein